MIVFGLQMVTNIETLIDFCYKFSAYCVSVTPANMVFILWLCVCACIQLFGKLQATKAEIQDLQEEHTKERQELEQTLMELTRELKLKYGTVPPTSQCYSHQICYSSQSIRTS